jgi:hypothetical protein
VHVDLAGRGGDDDVGGVDVESGGDDHDAERAKLSGDELAGGDVSMADLASSDSEPDTEDDEESAWDDGGCGGTVPSVSVRGTDPHRSSPKQATGRLPVAMPRLVDQCRTH